MERSNIFPNAPVPVRLGSSHARTRTGHTFILTAGRTYTILLRRQTRKRRRRRRDGYIVRRRQPVEFGHSLPLCSQLSSLRTSDASSGLFR